MNVGLYICSMTALQELKVKHKDAIKALQEAALPKTKEKGLVALSEIVGKNLKKSPQTIMNYINGRGKDGYLTEAITKEFQSL